MADYRAHDRRRRATRRARQRRRAMSLLELMLVLALLVMIGTLSLPAFRRSFAGQRMLKAGELVRIQWNKARIKAMKTGQIQMFRYEADGNTFQVEPYYTEQDYLEADAQHSITGQVTASPGATGATSQQPVPAGVERTLPKGVVFAHSEVQMDTRSYQIQQEMQGGSQGGQTADAGQLPPILFYPDGTTSDARVVLTNEHRLMYVTVSLRGLTGIARVSRMLSANELQTVQ